MTIHHQAARRVTSEHEPLTSTFGAGDPFDHLEPDDRSVAELCETVDPLIEGAPRLTVIGTGYLGATHAICMAARGYEVIGVDVDPAKIEALQDGRIPFHEPGLQELLVKVANLGRLRFMTSFEEAAKFGDVHFVCVGTPQLADGQGANMEFVRSAVDALGVHLDRPALVVGKSTVPVGTAASLATRLREIAPAGDDVELAWNPEFLREAHAVADTMAPDRLVFGVTSQRAEAMLRRAFQPVIARGTPIEIMDLATAELVKVAANSFLATKISFINAMAEVCEAAGADVEQLSEALALDPRIGGRFLKAGLGFGGGCLPKDIRAFMARAGELGADQALTFLREVDAINMRRRFRMVDLAREQCDGSFLGRRVAVFGAAFKPNSDDIRDSPALNVAAQVQLQGGEVSVYDPKAMDNARKMYPGLTFAETAFDAARGAHVVLHLTEWSEFREMDPVELGAVVAQRRVLDGRNALDPVRWRGAGWTYRALGRP
jgi:UDPglucose 6-dehydrogenase